MIGESEAAKAAVRGLGRPRHDRPLGAELAFVEDVLEFLTGWPAPAAPASDGVLSFVRHDFNEVQAADLGRVVRLASEGPVPRGMHLCGDTATAVRLFEADLPDAQAHVDALARRELGPRTMVLFTPASRQAMVLCADIPLPGLEIDLSRGKAAWTMDELDASLEEFNIGVIEASPLMGLVTDGHGLRPGGRRRYDQALYLHLRYGLGLDRRTGCGVRLIRTGLGLRPRTGGEEHLTTYGRRDASAVPRDEAAALGRHVARWSGGQGRPTLHVRCLCCDGSASCTVDPVPPGLTVGHCHLAP